MGIKKSPPRWADDFLSWYCNPKLLEEIQGDAYELYYRHFKESKYKADALFVWNVLRFFRWKNIRRFKSSPTYFNTSPAMLKNIFKVTVRNFMRQPFHSLFNLFGLSIGFLCAFLILLWVSHEFSFDRFHNSSQNIYKVIAHVQTEGVYQTFDMASAGLDVSSIPEVENKVTIASGHRWPFELCFRPDGKPNECIYMNGVYASESLFDVFNFPILNGDHNPLKETANIAISETMAEKLFGNESPIGKVIKIDDYIDVTIASVFEKPPVNSTVRFDFAMPFAIVKKLWGINDQQFNNNFFPTYIKTSSSISELTLTDKLNTELVLTPELKNEKVSYQAYPFTDWRLKSKFENGKNAGGRIEYIYIFIAIGIMVILMAIINFVNMTTARATTRAKEIGVRKATGALRGSIIIQFLSESFFTVLMAFILALFFTQLSLPYFNSLLTEPISMQWYKGWIPFYMFIGMIAVAVLAGIYPAFVMSSFQTVKILKSQSSSGTGSDRLRKSLLVIQLSISIGIIIFTGVMYQQLRYITTKDVGFERSNTVRVEPTMRIFKNFEALKNELLKNPYIVGVGTSNVNPLSSEPSTSVTWPGKPANTRIAFKTIGCSYEFPEMLGLKIKEGKNFKSQPQDSVYNEVLVSEDAVKTMNLKQPLGEHIEVFGSKCVIIGVVNDFHTASLQQARLPVILFRTPYEHTSAFYVRYQQGTTQQTMATLQEVYKKFEPSYTMKYWFQDDSFDELYKTEITASHLVLLFTIISIIIAIIGVIGLSTFNIMRKTKEMSIRRVFGASVTQVLTLLSHEFTIVIMAAVLVALPVAWYVSNQWLSGFVYHTAMPWWLFVASFASIAGITLIIIFIQGLTQLSANPSKVLRSE